MPRSNVIFLQCTRTRNWNESYVAFLSRRRNEKIISKLFSSTNVARLNISGAVQTFYSISFLIFHNCFRFRSWKEERKEHQSAELPSVNGKWGRWFVIRGATCNFYPSPSCLPSPFHDLKRVFASLRPARITTCIALATNIPPLHPPLTIFKTVAGNCSLLKVPQPLLSPSFNAVCRGCGRIRWKDSFHFLSNWLERYQEDRYDFRLNYKNSKSDYYE